MCILDIIILVCFVPAIVRGISKGFVSQAAALLALIAGVWIAFHFSDMLCSWLKEQAPQFARLERSRHRHHHGGVNVYVECLFHKKG